jgi:N-acetylglucosamine-6-phosphate deacetylase
MEHSVTPKAPKAILAERVFDGRTFQQAHAVIIEDARVQGLARWAEIPVGWPQRRLPAGALLAPGFIDLQVNGGGGLLLNDDPSAETMRAIARAHRRYGTTACLPTLITDTRQRTQAAIAAACLASGRDGVLGLHLEGPFISPNRPGVHPRDRIVSAVPSDLDWLAELGDAGHSLVTLAPECAPTGFVRDLAAAGIRIAAGHSEAAAEVMLEAAADGLTAVTHLFNAMPPLRGRDPGIIGTAFADDRLIAGLIVDGIHVDPIAVRAAFAAKGADGIALVTDAMPTVGASVDHFDLAGRTITLSAGRLVTADGILAGAHLDMASAVRNTVRLAQLPLGDVLRAASATPARLLGIENERGALIPGACADLVALSPELEVIATWVAGVEETAAR